jgi:hydroxymethylpyrimidine/phosphomethylpyrimidine kinase
MKRYPTVLTIAGSDSGGGAGIQADLKTIAALGAFGTSVITAITAQNTQGVRSIHPIPLNYVSDQLRAVFDDFQLDAVKIGMIHSAEIAYLIAEILDEYRPNFVVFDPVMVATSGAKLIQDDTIASLWTELFPRVDLITPNLDEAQLLTGRAIESLESIREAAVEMVDRGCNAVLLKGGHLSGERIFDVYAHRDGVPQMFDSAFINSRNLHGTGCSLSSAIATYRALGKELPEAIELARIYIFNAIESGKDIVTGKGHGPLNHSFDPQKMILL